MRQKVRVEVYNIEKIIKDGELNQFIHGRLCCLEMDFLNWKSWDH